MNDDELYQRIREMAENESAPTASMRMRARGYLQLYHASNGACRFALVASHGALWASWYLVCAKLAAMVFAVVDLSEIKSPLRRYRAFARYVQTLKEINKLVMVETYVLVHTVNKLGTEFAAKQGIPPDIASDYQRAISGENSDPDFLRELYRRHFLWEQERVVSDTLDTAFAEFDWPVMKAFCERPWVWFSYFKAGKSMNFKSFTDQEERVEKGLIAYDRAMDFGLDRLAKVTDVRLKILPGFVPMRMALRRKVAP